MYTYFLFSILEWWSQDRRNFNSAISARRIGAASAQPGKRLYGEDYEWIHHASSQYCGESTLERKDSVNVVTYDAVSIYKGQPDSIVGTTFMSFLVLLLFIWGMLLIEEFRAIYNLMYVIWYVPSIEDSNATFASIDDGKLFVRRQGLQGFRLGIHWRDKNWLMIGFVGPIWTLRLPKVHKFFAIFCIGLPRLVIAGVILVVGAFFLTATNNLQDLVLNSTAPWWWQASVVAFEHCFIASSLSCVASNQCCKWLEPEHAL